MVFDLHIYNYEQARCAWFDVCEHLPIVNLKKLFLLLLLY